MKVTRKFNLSRIGKNYESVDIESHDFETIEECVEDIEKSWRYYCRMIVEGKVQ